MEDLGTFVDFPSPPNSMYYVYGDAEQYLSESQSPNNSAYDITSAGDSRYPSPGHDDGESADPSEQQKPAAKRKRENRYKNAPPAVLSRRRAQNRASQRAYRERKDQRIKDLEQMLDDAKQRNDVLSQAYAALHAEYVALKSSGVGDSAGYPSQFDSMPYGAAAAAAAGGMGMGGGGAAAADGLEGMDMFVYGDLGSGGYHAL
ncbi:hypothetical protein C8A01DRAFT_40126 [Parachaetomium inaequale]|uniref:Putative transcription factor kapC n=1 Tax=Parachaetomium inaequale TaxID=2588326 RepID=A0AAN6SM38_9PEZI|nr:hypothetical protein C8A01DRAFT_40126 [Parachaetomium inaequale]